MVSGLKGLLQKKTLLQSGRAATIENVRAQLIRPVLTMPSLKYFLEGKMADLLAYLEIL
jgi:hypothetical protein